MALSPNYYAPKVQRLEKILAQKTAPKVPERRSYGNFCEVIQNPHFVKRKERGDQGKFFKNFPKSRPRLKGPKAHLGKWHYPLISMHLKGKDWRRFWGKKAAPQNHEWPSYGNFGKVAPNAHFLKKCEGGPKEIFSKIAQKDSLAEKAQKHTGANGIIL